MLRVITLFSGYDSQCLALNRLRQHNPTFDYELVAWCEVDRHAITAHNALFPQWADRNLGDISRVDWAQVPQCDLLTYSSPCQDFSQAGRQQGGKEGSGTRSSLLWECRKAIETLRPKYLLFENVPALVSNKFITTFLQWGHTLEALGYTNYWQCLNAKNYGVPQNRNRVFMISIHGQHQPYYFPKPFKLEKRLKDVLETDVPEKYYLSDDKVAKLLDFNEDRESKGMGFRFKPHLQEDEYVSTISTMNGGRPTDNFIAEPTVHCVGSINPDNTFHGTIRQSDRVYGTDGISPTIDTAQGGGRIHKVVIEQHRQYWIMEKSDTPTHTIVARPHGYFRGAEYKDFAPAVKSSAYAANNPIIEQQVLGWSRDERGNVVDRHPVDVANCVTSDKRDNTQNYVQEKSIAAMRGRADKEGKTAQKLEVGTTDTSNALTSVAKDNLLQTRTRIRRLTERELFRLMDVDEPDIDTLLNAGLPKTQLAKLAGNSIVVGVLYHIFNRLLIDTEAEANTQLKLI